MTLKGMLSDGVTAAVLVQWLGVTERTVEITQASLS